MPQGWPNSWQKRASGAFSRPIGFPHRTRKRCHRVPLGWKQWGGNGTGRPVVRAAGVAGGQRQFHCASCGSLPAMAGCHQSGHLVGLGLMSFSGPVAGLARLPRDSSGCRGSGCAVAADTEDACNLPVKYCRKPASGGWCFGSCTKSYPVSALEPLCGPLTGPMQVVPPLVNMFRQTANLTWWHGRRWGLQDSISERSILVRFVILGTNFVS